MLDFLGTAQPDANRNPGSVVRDLFVDLPASQIALLYNRIGDISTLQSLRLASGVDLIRLAQNLGAEKKSATAASGIALFTFSSLSGNVGINAGDIVTAQNGLSFSVITGTFVDSSKANYYRSVATKYADELSFLGNTDPYAVEVSLRSNVPGTSGNISKYSLVRSSIPGVSGITNIFPFSGGNNEEDDTAFRNRVLAIFSGSNIGTALGYRNTALTVSFVQDALVISPGDVLMTRDGTIISTNSSGDKVIISEGTGNKVDVVILGTNENDNVDTFIYRDKSNSNDPTAAANRFILGQIPGDENKTITRRRIDNLRLGVLPAQPVEEILEVSASLSGANFTPKSIDELGRITGNYELIKDTGVYAGSPWSQDYFQWISDHVSLFPEDIVKSQFNGQDSTAFTDVIDIPIVQQNISIVNENSIILNSDRSIIKLLHTPVASVSRVLNTNTGERYTVINQNLDGGTPNNISGRIKISGNTLPSSSDILQIDYTWIIDYDPFTDYDGKILKNNLRSSVDSIDWGMSNIIRNDRNLFTLNADGTLYTGSTSQPVSSVISANVVSTITGQVAASSVVNFSDRLAITLSAIDNEVLNITSIKLSNTEKELYITASADGLFFNNRIAVGTEIKFNISVILPTDASVSIGDDVEISFNSSDVFNITESTGSFVNNILTIPAANIIGMPPKVYLDINYIASSQDLLSFGITNMPVSRLGNGFAVNDNSGGKTNNVSIVVQRQNATMQKNVSNQYYIKLTLGSTDYALSKEQVVSVVDISTGKEYWNKSSQGTITTDTDGSYLLVMTGLNTPAIGDRVIAIYSFTDRLRTQPFTFSNRVIKYGIDSVDFDFTLGKFFVPISDITPGTALPFTVIEPSTGAIVGSGSDGYIGFSDGYDDTIFSSLSFNFSTLTNLKGKTISLSSGTNINDNGEFYPISLLSAHSVMMSPMISNITTGQVSIIRLSDNKDIWDPATCIILNNRLYLPNSNLITVGDDVIVLITASKPIHQSPTRLAITLSDQLTNSGVLTVNGTTITKVADVIFTATQNGLRQNILEAMKSFLGVSSTSSITADKSLVRLLKLEKVITTDNDKVLSVAATYDINGSSVRNDLFYSNEMHYGSDLSFMEFELPKSSGNLLNIPEIGDKLRISFVYSTANDFENLYFSRNGTLYTNKKFAVVSKIFPSSGFNSSLSARFIVSFFTQPATGSRYRAFYNYIAPKQNERVLIRTNFNQAIVDTTLAIEASRPINADVLVRAAKKILVDATLNIVVKTDYLTSAAIVKQNVKDKLTNTVNTAILGDNINSSDLIAAAQAVDGVDRARILYFNRDGELGQVLTILAEKDEYFSANDIIINQEDR